MAQKEKRTIQDIEWHELEMNGKKVRALNRRDAALYVGRTAPALDAIVERLDIAGYRIGFGRARYFTEEDLNRIKQALNTVRPAE